jgi:uncharacterized protein (DUF2141 family)
MDAIMAFIFAFGTGFAAPTGGLAISRIAAATLCLAALPGMTPVGSLEIQVTGLRSAKGVLQLCLTRDAGDFPDCRSAAAGLKRTVSAADPTIRFEGLAQGNYAVAIIHDANANAKLDTMLGIPKEGFGFSRNPAIRFGPPRFDAARFAVDGSGAVQQIRMRYML